MPRHAHSARHDFVLVIIGRAWVEPGQPASRLASYQEKYASDITRIGLDPAGFDGTYSVCLRITLERFWGH